MVDFIFPKTADRVIYAIGDVHGELSRLNQLHALIVDRHKYLYPDLSMHLVHLGDYVDRGPDSAGVISRLIELEARPEITCTNLLGNHEEMMLDALDDHDGTQHAFWVQNGGDATLESYNGSVPLAHSDWLKTCPRLHVEEDAHLIFVHAGINPDVYPNDPEATYLWTRSKRFFRAGEWANPALYGWTVVHGHTPTETFFPDTEAGKARRINIDTGAVYGGRLTAAVFAPGEDVRFMYA